MRRLVLLLCIGLILSIVTVPYASASWVLVPNGSFESGTVGLVPDDWFMRTYDNTDPPDAPKTATFIHEMQQTDQKYFEGTKSLWLHSRIVDEGLRIGRGSGTVAETAEWIDSPFATRIRIYMRDIVSTHSLGWGWDNSITVTINNVSIAETWAVGQYWPYIFTHGETLNWNLYNYTATGEDGQNWYVYEYGIPASVDKTHMKMQIIGWAWDWTFYSTDYYSDLEFTVDKVELLEVPPYADIAVTNVTPAKTVVGQTCCMNISVVLSNYGNNDTGSFDALVYANTTVIHTFVISNLGPFETETLTFVWNTTDVAKGKHVISAYVAPLPSEQNTADNQLTDGIVKVTIVGDVDGDFDVDIFDVVTIASCYGSKLGQLIFKPNADIDNDGAITILDIVKCTAHYGQRDP